ncbi:MAG: hypothetical protein ILA29_02105 [Prevotella sp.]|nr:hypothetical protein [Prevotella sp.]
MLFAVNAKGGGGGPVVITKEMVINEVGSGDAMLWFDEQTAASAPTTRWKTSGNTACWPAGLVLDLGREYEIESIRLFDMEKAYRAEGGRLEIATGRPFEWQEAKSVDMENRGEWRTVAIGRRTQYLHLVKQATVMCNLDGQYPENCDVNIGEVIIIGKPVGKVHKTKKPRGKRPKPVTMDRFIGMNSYINTDERLYEAVGTVREYRPWKWNGVTSTQTPISWKPMNVGDGDRYYQHMHELGIDCMPCIHRNVENSASEQVPSFGADPNNPETYRLMADYSFQFVARYGSTHVGEHLLRTTEPSPKKSGLGYIRYFENWNEQNREWGDPACHFTPYMFAAFSSASYDGHLKTMGKGIGVKTADPKMNYVMGGLAGLSLDYIKAMKLWSDYHRHGSFPADVLNVHHYCNTRGRQHPGEKANGISPEDDHLREKLAELVAWRDSHLPDRELWLTEIGWDTDTISYQSAAEGHKLFPKSMTMDEIQAQWLARTFLIASAAGIDRVMMYLANDISGYTAPVYGRCGMVTTDGRLKPSFYYLATLRHALRGMTFDSDVSTGDGVTILLYRNGHTGQKAYTIWSPTADGTIIPDYQLRTGRGKTGSVKIVELRSGMRHGVELTATPTDGRVTLTVDETPKIVIVE